MQICSTEIMETNTSTTKLLPTEVFKVDAYISFSPPFSYYPVVVATPEATGVIANIQGWTSSGFTLKLTNNDGTAYVGSTYVHWIAIGAR
jgi:spore maturation protein SpmA